MSETATFVLQPLDYGSDGLYHYRYGIDVAIMGI